MKKYGVHTKAGPSVIKDVDGKKGIVTSYPSTFGVIDSGRERVLKGAFARTINAWGPEGKKRTKVLFNHEPWNIIGRPLALSEDSYGLLAESHIIPTQLGKDVLMLIENEVITEQSIGYTPVKQEKNEQDGVIDIMEVKLYEYSFLAWGMNSETPILGLKGQDFRDSLSKDMRRVEKVLASGEFNTEEIPEMLDRVLKQWREDLNAPDEDRQVNLAGKGSGVIVEDLVTRLSTLGDMDAVKRAISELQSLLPADSPDGTPKGQDSIESIPDSTDSHSEALAELLAKVEEMTRQDSVALMLRQFQTKLGC